MHKAPAQATDWVFNLGVDNPLGLSYMFNIGINTDADRKAGQHGTNGNNLYYAIPLGY
ncbi:MAG: hypothetical protein H7240_05355 [Glaciimonas sp.]|nr:hypothetical protein [Glaciimonas sp.]